MANSIHVASKSWTSADNQNLEIDPPNNSNGFDLRFSFAAGTLPAGAVARLTAFFSADGVTFNPWIGPQDFSGEGNDKFGQPRTSFGLGAKWPVDGAAAVRASKVRVAFEVLQTYTASLDVVTN